MHTHPLRQSVLSFAVILVMISFSGCSIPLPGQPDKPTAAKGASESTPAKAVKPGRFKVDTVEARQPTIPTFTTLPPNFPTTFPLLPTLTVHSSTKDVPVSGPIVYGVVWSGTKMPTEYLAEYDMVMKAAGWEQKAYNTTGEVSMSMYQLIGKPEIASAFIFKKEKDGQVTVNLRLSTPQ